MNDYRLLDRRLVVALLPDMQSKKVSLVARGKTSRIGFTEIFLKGQSLDTKIRKNQTWAQRRNNFIKRHLARKNPLWRKGKPTRQHLALIAWGYSPTPKKLKEYVESLDKINKNVSSYIR